MFKTLLFDLDGTLLPVDRDEFIKRYLESVARFFAQRCEPAVFTEKLLQSTRVMMMNDQPEKTNAEVFWNDFTQRLGLSREEILPLFKEYYSNHYPALRRYTRPEPIARQIVDMAVAKGREMVIATNPVFPETAIRQRMEWADIDHLPFRMVTTYENTHFCKPHPEYYAEILRELDRHPRDCLMIGNDVQEDLAASRLGIATYLVKNNLIMEEGNSYTADYEGYLDDLHQFINSL